MGPQKAPRHPHLVTEALERLERLLIPPGMMACLPSYITAVSIAKRANESSATGPPTPPPPCLWTCFPSYLLPSLAFL